MVDQEKEKDRLLRRRQYEIQFEPKCPNCEEGDHLIEDSHEGTLVCTKCGAIVSERLVDLGQEWREFADDEGKEEKSRVGEVSNPLLPSDFITDVGSTKGIGKSVFKAHTIAYEHDTNKNLKEGFQKIGDISDKLQLPSQYKTTAQELFKNVHQNKPIKSTKDLIGFAAASLYAACKMSGIPRQMKDFMYVTNLSKKELGQYYKRIDIDLKRNPSEALHIIYDPSTPIQMVPRFSSKLQLSPRVQIAAEHVCKRAIEMGLAAGKNPTTVTATAIYFCCKWSSSEKRDIRQVSEVTGVGEATIKKHLKDFEASRNQLLPPHFSPLAKDKT
jgi:transcription initiation factor TFIIB